MTNETEPQASSTASSASSNDPEGKSGGRRLIKIGSQRDALTRSTPQVESGAEQASAIEAASAPPPAEEPMSPAGNPGQADQTDRGTSAGTVPLSPGPGRVGGTGSFPPPRINRDSEELQTEIEAVLSTESLEQLLKMPSSGGHQGEEPQVDQRYRVAVVKIHHDDVFVLFPSNHEGVVPYRSFAQDPKPGDVIEVIVSKYSTEDELYYCRLAGASVEVLDWSDLVEGAIVEARITGHNVGGLECEVNRIRGFIPLSQVALVRVERLDEFVGQRLLCLVTEVNPVRGNLVLSRRAVQEREREASRKSLLEAIQPGQIREGVIRGIKDFGAFVDLGGVDGLIHISKLSWEKVQHPSQVVEEGQRVKVKVEKIDPVTGKISLSYRDLVEQPWAKASQDFPVNAVVTGTVTRITDFGAFVRLAAGIEGLVHISELAHHRVSRPSSVVHVGQEVKVKVLSVDPEDQRMSLSIKAALAPQKTDQDIKPTEDAESQVPTPSPASRGDSQVLRGGINRATGGEQFGLRW